MKYTTVYVDETGQPLAPEEQERLRKLQLEDDKRRDASQRQRADCLKSITLFKKQRRDWISIHDIIDWRSRDRETGAMCEDFQIAALRDVDLAIRTGKYFFVGEQSRILLTLPFVDLPAALIEEPLTLPECYWLSRAQWQVQHELAPAQRDESEPNRLKRLFRTHLQWAWIPRELCLRWSKNVPFVPRPEWLEGMAQEAASSDCAGGVSSDDEQHPKSVATTPASELSPPNDQAKPQRRLAEAKIEPEFKRWREQQREGYLPTGAEDIAHMKQLGVSRDAVRELRKKFRTRERGQKKSG